MFNVQGLLRELVFNQQILEIKVLTPVECIARGKIPGKHSVTGENSQDLHQSGFQVSRQMMSLSIQPSLIIDLLYVLVYFFVIC